MVLCEAEIVYHIRSFLPKLRAPDPKQYTLSIYYATIPISTAQNHIDSLHAILDIINHLHCYTKVIPLLPIM